jgi:hypothetical protein
LPTSANTQPKVACAAPVHPFHIGSGSCVTVPDAAPVPGRQWLR